MSSKRVKVIDLFAGPGGLGEGFTSLAGQVQFDIALSIEKDKFAHQTLSMRARYRELLRREQLEPYYELLNGKKELASFLEDPAVQRIEATINDEALLWEMNPDNRKQTTERIRKSLGGSDYWVLIGGPPCQAYSLVGRARNRNVADFQDDARHFLYQEYLNVLTELHPPVFVMENVKGLLSSQNRGDGGMFQKIIHDLENVPGHGYRIHPVSEPRAEKAMSPSDYIVRSEDYGIPQARHRVILLGIRKDLPVDFSKLQLVKSDNQVSAYEVIKDLPSIRSRLSRGDSYGKWCTAVRAALSSAKAAFRNNPDMRELAEMSAAEALNLDDYGNEHVAMPEFINHGDTAAILTELRDPRLELITGHRTRSHMSKDLERYFFSAVYTAIKGTSPKMRDFPHNLMPNHRNVDLDKPESIPFQDRFKVVRRDNPAHTVVAHMSKDGHAFIHWDSSQIRSLTIREAARLQTFPDNYLFMGPQTARYAQVGNAVPPLLARQIAQVVARIFQSP